MLIKENLAERLKYYFLHFQSCGRKDEDNYAEVEEIVEMIDELIRHRINELKGGDKDE